MLAGPLKLLGPLAFSGYVARNGEHTLEVAIVVAHCRDDHVPPFGSALGRCAKPAVSRRPVALGPFELLGDQLARFIAPDTGPMLAEDALGAVELHGLECGVIDQRDIALRIEQDDGVCRSLQDAAVQLFALAQCAIARIANCADLPPAVEEEASDQYEPAKRNDGVKRFGADQLALETNPIDAKGL
jgi:hypothetical protein